MSIVVAAEPPDALAVTMWAGVMLVIGLGLAHWVGVFRSRNVVGPVRWSAGEQLGGLFIVAAAGMVVWYAAQVALVSITLAASGTAPTTQAMARLTAHDWATLATVPGILALGVLVLGDRLLGKEMIDRLGYGPRELFHGPWTGIIGLVVLIPLLFAMASVAELVYRLIGFEHPAAHDMLLKMSEAPGGWGRRAPTRRRSRTSPATRRASPSPAPTPRRAPARSTARCAGRAHRAPTADAARPAVHSRGDVHTMT